MAFDLILEGFFVIPLILGKAKESDVDLTLAGEKFEISFCAEGGLESDLGLDALCDCNFVVELVIETQRIEGFLELSQ